MYALNPKRSPENVEFWERADPIAVGAGHVGSALMTSTDCHPGVSDSIELHNGRQATRRATSKALGDKSSSMATNVKRGGQMAASRVMGTGTPQRLAMKWGNAH